MEYPLQLDGEAVPSVVVAEAVSLSGQFAGKEMAKLLARAAVRETTGISSVRGEKLRIIYLGTVAGAALFVVSHLATDDLQVSWFPFKAGSGFPNP